MMKGWRTLLASVMAGCLLLSSGCKPAASLQDGSYRAETRHFDSRGYKDYLEISVSGGEISEVHYDAVKEDGGKKTLDQKYREDMDAVQETYPEKFSQDLVNQLLDGQSTGGVDAIAGATYSSDTFNALLAALVPAMTEGGDETVVIDNLPEK